MDEEDDIFEMFLEIMEQLHADDPNGRMRILSKDPRYASADPVAQKAKTEKR